MDLTLRRSMPLSWEGVGGSGRGDRARPGLLDSRLTSHSQKMRRGQGSKKLVRMARKEVRRRCEEDASKV